MPPYLYKRIVITTHAMSIRGGMRYTNETKWAKEHPGGDIPLLNLAGQDVSDAFIAFHPGTAWKYLDKLFTGYHLKDYKVSEVFGDYRKVVSKFAKAGMFEKKGHGFWKLLDSYAFGVILGLAWMQISYLGHDAGHYQMRATQSIKNAAYIKKLSRLTN
ncbi:hypothetical protein R6Q59_002372 [Mikania micrantha]